MKNYTFVFEACVAVTLQAENEEEARSLMNKHIDAGLVRDRVLDERPEVYLSLYEKEPELEVEED